MVERMNANRHLVLSNTYGHPNVGDEAILTAMIDELQERVSCSTITVLSARPEFTRRRHQGVRVVRSHTIRGSRETFETIQKADLLIVGGGGIIQDDTSLGNLLFHLSRAAVASMVGTPFICYGVGVGPLHSHVGRYLTAAVLSKAVAITTRDRLSAVVLREIGVPDHLVKVTSDPAVNLRVRPDDRLPPFLDRVRRYKAQGQPVIGISLRPILSRYRILPRAYRVNQPTEELVEVVAEAVSRLVKRIDGHLLFYSMHPDQDDSIGRLFAAQLADYEETTIVSGTLTPKQMVRAAQLSDLLIGMRLHSLILASHSARPLIALSYASKVKGYMELLGQPECVLTEDRWLLEPLIDLIESSWHDRVALSTEIARQFTELQGLARRNVDLVTRIVERR